MERLTERDEFGNADIISVNSEDLQCNLTFDEFNKVTNALNKLAEYEELEEQGKLLKLPCAVGDTVYCIMTSIKGTNPMIFSQRFDYSMIESFGKSVFLAREEAEAALKALED